MLSLEGRLLAEPISAVFWGYLCPAFEPPSAASTQATSPNLILNSRLFGSQLTVAKKFHLELISHQACCLLLKDQAALCCSAWCLA